MDVRLLLGEGVGVSTVAVGAAKPHVRAAVHVADARVATDAALALRCGGCDGLVGEVRPELLLREWDRVGGVDRRQWQREGQHWAAPRRAGRGAAASLPVGAGRLGGHRAAATALEALVKKQNRPWDVRLVDLQDVLDELDIFRKLTGLRMEDIYNTLLERGWTLGSAQIVPLMHAVIRFYHAAQVRVLTRYWSTNTPDMVVSLVPNFERSLWQAVQKVDPRIPFVTILTDMADYPPSFWIERQKQIFICGTAKAAQQVREISPESTAHQVSGMIINPKFYEVPPVDVAAERAKLGLDATRPTGLVLFGGMGSEKMEEILNRIDQSNFDVQLIFICGRNEKLRRRLSERPTRIAKFVEGFTPEIPRYMQLADFLIVLREVDYQTEEGAISTKDFERAYRPFLTELAQTLRDGVEPYRELASSELWGFWERILDRCAR